jgi:DNA modification methylase
VSEKVYSVVDLEKPFGNCESLYGKFGRVDFTDCANASGRIADKVFDLAFWDPPFNVGYGKQAVAIKDKTYDKFRRASGSDVVLYEDTLTREEYLDFLGSVLMELRRVSKCVIVHPGNAKGDKQVSNERLWFEQFPPDYSMTRLVRNPKAKAGIDQNCYLRRRNPLLGYGKPPKPWRVDIFDTTISWGFLSKYPFLHPCPMDCDFLVDLIGDCKAKFVYDPMCGSGAVPEACEILGVNWYANELKDEYRTDVEYRIKRGQPIRRRNSVKVSKLLGGKCK